MNDSAPPLILIRENKTWAEALDYCRENYNDLVSVYDRHIQGWAAEKAKLADSPYVWLGIRYTCTMGFWFWVGGQQPCYENWAQGKGTGDCEMSGAMERAGDSQWFSLSDAQRLNFICSNNTNVD
ncbi:snaclec 5-like [Myripristis murdjan]|uniref:snaclec 5-like n=1 Tax=Myripristis murdjan TaxID=586833 RepID=UPI001175FD72|nr:snaclec 5-like [Myripristis murdjan]